MQTVLASLAPASGFSTAALLGGLAFFLGIGVIVTAINAKGVSHIVKGKIVAVGIVLMLIGVGAYALRTML